MFNVYKGNETDFNHNGIAIIDDIIVSCEVEHELNTTFICNMTIINNNIEKFNAVEKEVFIKIPTPIGMQLFRVVDVNPSGTQYKDVFLRHVFYDLEKRICKRCKIEQSNGAFTLNKFKACLDKEVPHTFTSDISTLASLDWHLKKGVTALIGDEENSFIKKFGGELWVDNFNVAINKRVGKDRGFIVKYRKNIEGFSGAISTDGMITRGIPKGYDGITLEDNGHIDSPLINNYSDIYSGVVEFSDIKWNESTNNKDEEGYPSLEEAQAALRDAMKEYFENTECDIPKATFNIDIVALQDTEEYKDLSILEELFIGDSVTIDYEPFNIEMSKRMIKYTYNALTQKYNSIVLGTNEENYFKDINNKIDNALTKDDLSNVLEDIINSTFDKVDDMISNGGSSSYVKFIPNIKNPSEILITDNENIDKAVYVVRLNKNGIGVSSTGYNGQYQGIVTNGKLAINEVTSNLITANLIRLGTLSDATGTSWINMENGTFNFADKITFDGNSFNIKLQGGESIQTAINDAKDNIFPNGSFSDGNNGWTKYNVTISSPSLYNSKRVFCNFYTSTSNDVRYAENVFEIEPNKFYTFSCILAQYSTTKKFYRIRIETQNSNSETWSTLKEFTGETSGTRNEPEVISYKFKSGATVKKFRMWIGKLEEETFDIYVGEIYLSKNIAYARQSEIEVLDEKIVSKVSSGDIGTLIEQNSYAVKIAWNNNTKYVQFENGGIGIYNGAISTTEKRAFFDEKGTHFWRDGLYLGKIGTNKLESDASKKGITFDIESSTCYMCWAVKKTDDTNVYTTKWTYANTTMNNYASGRLHAGCDIDMHNYYLRNVNFEGGGINGTLNFVQVASINSNGTVSRWFNNCKLVFSNGILIDSTWGAV